MEKLDKIIAMIVVTSIFITCINSIRLVIDNNEQESALEMILEVDDLRTAKRIASHVVLTEDEYMDFDPDK